MRKALFFAALASVALASCVNDDASDNVQNNASPQQITFNAPVVSGVTRTVAGEQPNTSTQKYDTGESFRVYAQWDKDGSFEQWITANNESQALYMANLEVGYVHELNAWAPSTNYYWPKTGALTFAAYSPSDVNEFNPTYAEDGLTVNKFTVKANTAEQYDFMFSERSYNRTASTNTLTGTGHTANSYNGVDMLFHHALASIKFKVKAYDNYPNTTIRVKQITILNVYSTADFTENITTGTTYVSTPKWTDWENMMNYAVKSSADNQELSGDWAQLQRANDVLLIPQAFDRATDDVCVLVEYSIQNGTGPELSQNATLNLATGNNGTYYKDQDNNDLGAWEMGKRYTYNITIALDKIYFSPEVTNWVDVNVTPDLSI